MKIIQCLALLIVLVLVAPVSTRAHDGWIEPGQFLVERGQPLQLQLLLGNHSNGHKSYRLAGKWALQYVKLLAIDPRGQENDLTGRLVDLGEDEEKVGPKGVKGFHAATFTAPGEGFYQLLAKTEQVHQFGDGVRSLGIRTAKSAFASLKIPTLAAARTLKGFDRPVIGEKGLEIIPLMNPLGLTEGDPIALELRHKGKPIAGKVVAIIRKIDGASSARELTTNEQGRITFTVGPPDLYLVRANVEEESEKIEGKYEKSNYETTYVFPVFTR